MAESADQGRLNVNKPGRKQRHHRRKNAVKKPHSASPEQRHRRKDKDEKVSSGTKYRERQAGNFGVSARKHHFAALGNAARHRLGRVVMDR